MALPPADISDEDGPAYMEYQKARGEYAMGLPEGSDTSNVPSFKQYQKSGGFAEALASNEEDAAKAAKRNKVAGQIGDMLSRKGEKPEQARLRKLKTDRERAIFEQRTQENLGQQQKALEFAKKAVARK